MTKTDKQLKIFQEIVSAALQGAGMFSENLQAQQQDRTIVYDSPHFFNLASGMQFIINKINEEYDLNKEPETND